MGDAVDETDREQRMAAKLEEMIVAADPLDAEHVGPDRGDRAISEITLRGARKVCARTPALGHGQRLAIELAVGGERQRVEQDERGRHHVVGQALAQARAARR